jgi:hypothetical protein
MKIDERVLRSHVDLDVAFFFGFYNRTKIIWTAKAATFDRGQSKTREEYRMNWVWVYQLRKDDSMIDRFVDLALKIDTEVFFCSTLTLFVLDARQRVNE